jgi:UDP-glucose 4-epimerase
LYVERVLQWYERAHDFRWAALRYFNAAGADPEGEIGEAHHPELHLIPLAIEATLGKKSAINVMGTDYSTFDGTAIRDYIHVDDLADAHVKALEHLLDGGKSMALNLGTGRGHSVREVIKAVERAAGRSVPVRESARRPGDPPVLVADASLAQGMLDWNPRYVNLDEIVRTAWNWHASQVVHYETAVAGD